LTIYVPDVSGWDDGIDLAGALAVFIKVTEGTGYLSPSYSGQVMEARHHGAFPEAYHFLHQGSAGQQAVFCHAHAGALPLAIDAEPTTVGGKPARHSVLSHDPRLAERLMVSASSAPTIEDICEFTDAYRKAGGIIWWVYLPRWYWVQLGSPSLKPLIDRGLLLWSSDYSAYTDADTGRGWQGYGGYWQASAWQYTSTLTFGGMPNVDFSAFRGSRYAGLQDDKSVDACLAEFRSLSLTGRYPVPAPAWTFGPLPELTVLGVGPDSVKVRLRSPAGFTGTPPVPAPAVHHYQIYVMRDGRKVDDSYPRYLDKDPGTPVQEWQGGGIRDLPPRTRCEVWVRATLEDGSHSSEWAKARFRTQG